MYTDWSISLLSQKQEYYVDTTFDVCQDETLKLTTIMVKIPLALTDDTADDATFSQEGVFYRAIPLAFGLTTQLTTETYMCACLMFATKE